LPRVDGTGQRERAGEASVLPLNATEVLLFLFLLDLALAMDGERVALDADINVFFVDAGDFKLQRDVVLVFVDDLLCEQRSKSRCGAASGWSYFSCIQIYGCATRGTKRPRVA